MASARGRSEVKRYMAALPGALTRNVLRPAARAGGKVIADEARDRVTSEEVRDDIVVRSRAEGTQITVTVTVRPGFSRSIGTWLEYGTSAHFISVDDSQSGGRSVARINQLAREGSLVIGGQFVGATVLHPGAKPYPFLRPALDAKAAVAIAATQDAVDAKLRRSGVTAEAGSEE